MSHIQAPMYELSVIEHGVLGGEDYSVLTATMSGFDDSGKSRDSQVLSVVRELSPFAEDFTLQRIRQDDPRILGRWAIARDVQVPILRTKELSNGLVAEVTYVYGGRVAPTEMQTD